MKYALLSLIALQGCVQTPEIVERPVYVDVPLVKPCLTTIPKEPVYETSRVVATDKLDPIATAYMVEREQRKIYIKQLRALLAGCIPVMSND